MRRLLPLLIALGLCAALSVLILSGCGGDGPAGPQPDPDPEPKPLPTEEIAGTLDLPAGWTGDPADLRVVDILQMSDCDAQGGFTLLGHEDHTQLALALGPDDGLVLMGWFGAEDTVLSTRTTAEVLAWMGIGAWMQPGDAQTHIRDLLSDPELDLAGLEAAWSDMLADAAGGLVAESQALHDALQAVVDGLLAAPGKGVIIEPGEQLSGIDVLNQGGINRVTLQNNYRRRVAGFLWRLGYRDTNNVDILFDEPELVEQLEIPPVEAFQGVLGSIVGIVMGDMSYEPVQTDPIQLDWRDDAKRDYYRFNALGMGLPGDYPPGLYTAEEVAQGTWVGMKNVVLDFFLPLLLNVSGAVGVAVDEMYDSGDLSDLTDFISYCSSSVPDFYDNVQAGAFWPSLHTIWDTALTNGVFQEKVRDLLAAGLVRGRFTAGEAGEIMEGVNRAFVCIGIVDLIGGFMDNAITGTHFAVSNAAETWEFTVTTPVVHIEPREADVMIYDTKLLTMVIDDDTGGYPEGWAYAYRWRSAGAHGTLVNPIDPGDTSNDFMTSSDWVHYVADHGSEGDETVTCELYVTLGTDETCIRDAVCELEVKKQHIVLEDTLKTCPGGTVEMRPTLDPPYDGEGTLLWTWDGGGAGGVLRGPNYQAPPWTSSNNLATFLEDSEGGDDWVTCVASIEYGDGTVSPIDTVEVFIEDIGEFEPYYGEHFCYSWFIRNEDTGWCREGARTAIRFEVIPGVLRYHIHGSGFYDPYYYGDEYDLTIRTQYLDYWEDGVAFISLTFHSEDVNCGDPSSEEDLCAGGLARFEGAVWEITPVCP